MSRYVHRTKPLHIKILVCVLGLLVFACDLLVPSGLNVAIFYCFVIVLCAWTGSRRFLWMAAVVFSGLTIPGLLLPSSAVTGRPLAWVDWANRFFGIGALLLVAVFTDLRMHGFLQMERVLRAKDEAEREVRESELRLRLAQVAGNLGSWEWSPSDNTFSCSKECFELFGVNVDAGTFIRDWMANVHPADLDAVRSAMNSGTERGEFNLDYRYQHPTKGLRWIQVRAKMFERGSRGRRLFGIHQDITERKQVESVLQQSQSTLESLVEQRTAALRRLSATLLQSQDEERRRIARELHDSFGQYLASLKINLDLLAELDFSVDSEREHGTRLLSDSLKIVQQCMAETRTLSYLLHPVLLEQAGFFAAARWYVEGFAQRSNIEVRLDVSPEFAQLPAAVEMAFFRALQECLTNVHRYSNSSSVDVILESDAEEAMLIVRDYGRGLPPQVLKRFRDHGIGTGVGLSGMRERMLELGGTLEISSDDHGTTVQARVPLLNVEEGPATKVA